jgi:hypothetical protein
MQRLIKKVAQCLRDAAAGKNPPPEVSGGNEATVGPLEIMQEAATAPEPETTVAEPAKLPASLPQQTRHDNQAEKSPPKTVPILPKPYIYPKAPPRVVATSELAYPEQDPSSAKRNYLPDWATTGSPPPAVRPHGIPQRRAMSMPVEAYKTYQSLAPTDGNAHISGSYSTAGDSHVHCRCCCMHMAYCGYSSHLGGGAEMGLGRFQPYPPLFVPVPSQPDGLARPCTCFGPLLAYHMPLEEASGGPPTPRQPFAAYMAGTPPNYTPHHNQEYTLPLPQRPPPHNYFYNHGQGGLPARLPQQAYDDGAYSKAGYAADTAAHPLAATSLRHHPMHDGDEEEAFTVSRQPPVHGTPPVALAEPADIQINKPSSANNDDGMPLDGRQETGEDFDCAFVLDALQPGVN